MNEGHIKEDSYYFPAFQIQNYLDSLPLTEYLTNNTLLIHDKVVIITHDDQLQDDWLSENATWFLHDDHYTFNDVIDIGIHFDKTVDATFDEQINQFENRPIFNRNHRLLWRSDNFDFPFLAMKGIKIDSSKIGGYPHYPVISSKEIPILELPITILDYPKQFSAGYNINDCIELYFKEEFTPITVLSHPLDICKEKGYVSCYPYIIYLSKKYGYKIIDVSTFYGRYVI